MKKEYEMYTSLDIFPKVREIKCSPDYIGKEERYQFQYPIIMRYLKNKISGWNIGDFLYEIGIQKVALYAITEFTELVINDLERCSKPIEVMLICDKNSKKYEEGYLEYEVTGIDNLLAYYKSKKIDKVLICSIFHVNEIFSDLMERGIRLDDMLSVNSAIVNGGI